MVAHAQYALRNEQGSVEILFRRRGKRLHVCAIYTGNFTPNFSRVFWKILQETPGSLFFWTQCIKAQNQKTIIVLVEFFVVFREFLVISVRQTMSWPVVSSRAIVETLRSRDISRWSCHSA